MKYLIVNADDFNLTRGINRAILECHDHGIVTSTTLLVTLPLSAQFIQALKSRPHLGKGIHLSLTLGDRVHPKTPFALNRGLLPEIHRIPADVAEREYEAQILKFKNLLGKLPTHMDTHHHIHGHANIFDAIRRLSRKYKIPYRKVNHSVPGATHFLFEDLDPERHWTRDQFLRCLKHLPKGISEIMVHPGYVDQELRHISSFLDGREFERRFLSDRSILRLADRENIKLIHFGDLRYFGPLFE